MKKSLILLLVSLLAVFAAACGSSATDEVEGNWYVVSEGSINTLVLNGDGTGTAGTIDITYEYEAGEEAGEIDIDLAGTVLHASIVEDDALGWIMKNGDHIAAYKDKAVAKEVQQEQLAQMRAQQGASTSDPNAPVSTNSIPTKEDFIGHWDGLYAIYNDSRTSLDDLNATFTIDINADGTAAAFTDGEADGAATWTYDETFGEITMVDGTGEDIVCEIDGDLLLFPLRSEEGDIYTVVLTKK